MNLADESSGFDVSRFVNLDWSGPGALRSMGSARDGRGLQDGVEVLRLTVGEGREYFLLTVCVADNVVLASPMFRWCDVRPPRGAVGEAAAQHVLRCLADRVRETRAGFSEYTWVRVASELREVRRLLAEIPCA